MGDGKNPLMRCSEKDRDTVKQSEDAQHQFKESVLQGKDFSDAEKATVQFTSVEQFQNYWNQANRAQGDFDDKHEAGCGLCVRRYQSSGDLVLGFMKDFSPIVDAVKNFASPYGGLAIGTISLVFVVARNKDSVEKTLALTISEIRNRLPGIDLYRHIYDENHALDHTLQNQIVAAYQTFIDFCIVATKYYKARGARRWLKALGPPGSLVDSATNVQDSFVDIKRTSHELLAKNVDRIKKKNEDLEKKVSALQDQLTNRDTDDFQQAFKLESFSEETLQKTLAARRDALAMELDINAGFLQQLRGPHLDQFISKGVYEQWDASEQPCLLILSGQNFPGLLSQQCWLSRVAISTIDRVMASAAHCAYYVLSQQEASLYQVLPSILLQLMAKKRDMLRVEKQRDALRAELHEYRNSEMKASRMNGYDSRTNPLHNIARRVVQFFDESETVYIIVDRTDWCCDYVNYDHRKSLVDSLVQMVNAARCRLKILAVADSSSWSVEEHQDDLRIPKMERVVVHTMHQKTA